MASKIFPSSILEQSADQVLSERSRLSGIIYLTVLVVIVGSLVAINFIRVDVTVHAGGIIKPRKDHTVITSTVSGFIRPVRLELNAHVNEGDTLLVIESELISVKLPQLEKRKSELEALTTDLHNLTTQSPYSVKLQSPMYKQDVLCYISQWNDADAKRKAARTAYERNKRLYDANVIPLSEFEPVELEYTQAENAIRSLTSCQKRQWQSDLYNYDNELAEILTQIEQIRIQDSETAILSPVGGTIQQSQTLFEGTFVTAGQQIVEISPDGDLVAECYIEPKDVGYIKTGMQGRVQVSAFNYTQWGVLTATVDELFDDVMLSSNGTQSFYKMYCSLDSDHLTLKNGYEGYIKKGMTVNANFIVTSRTIFQLLYDKLDNWLNPNTTYSERNE